MSPEPDGVDNREVNDAKPHSGGTHDTHGSKPHDTKAHGHDKPHEKPHDKPHDKPQDAKTHGHDKPHDKPHDSKTHDTKVHEKPNDVKSHAKSHDHGTSEEKSDDGVQLRQKKVSSGVDQVQHKFMMVRVYVLHMLCIYRIYMYVYIVHTCAFMYSVG